MSANPDGAKFSKKVRRELLIIEATKLARQAGGWNSLTHNKIAEAAKCSRPLVCARLGSIDEIRTLIMKAAIRYEYLDLIAQGIAAGFPACLKLSPVLKHKAINCLMGE